MKRKNGDVEGNAVASAQAFAEQMIRAGEVLLRLERHLGRLEDDGWLMDSISLRPPSDARTGWLAVARWSNEGKRYVTFISGDTYQEVVTKFARAVENRSLTFREDKYG